jgi:hypothetical protein
MVMRIRPRGIVSAALAMAFAGLVGGLVACGADAASDEAMGAPPAYPGQDAYPDAGATGGSGGGASADAGLPPEQEVESSYESPVATGRFVWVANPVSGRVAYVDAATLEVRTVPAGNSPRYMAAIPDPERDVAVVINELSGDATLLRADAAGNVQVSSFDVADGANAWAVSPSGRWAIAWTNAASYPKPDPVQGFQDVTVVDLLTEKATRLSVGYRPVALSFSLGDEHAYAVTQDGVSVIDLTLPQGPLTAKLVPISEDPFEDPGTRDVSITPDGSLAFVRRDGSSQVTVVSLADGELVQVQLAGDCTDLDLSADGTRALAAVRDRGEIAILPVPEIASAPETFQVVSVPNATVGSVAIAAEAPVALVYTNAAQEPRITKILFDTTPPAVRTLKLHAAVLGVFPSRSGASAVVVHQPVEGAFGSFSALTLAPELPAKIVATQAPVTAVALTPSGDRAIVAERSDAAKKYGAYLVRSENQQVDRYALSSPPIAVGAVVGAKRAFVAQEHPEGRLTFIDLDTGLSRTLTGFELAARVIDGSQP